MSSHRARYRIEISPRAQEEIDGNREYINARSPQNAQRMHQRVLSTIDELVHMPRRHGMALEARRYKKELRQAIVWPYRIVYQVLGEHIRVHMVRHGAMLPAKDLKLE